MQSLKGNLQERAAFLRLRAGDSEAFVFFYDRYVKNIYRFVLIKVSDRSIAEDLTQDIFLKIWQHLVDKKDIKSFRAFIFRIARNTIVDYYRRNQRQSLPLEFAGEQEFVDIATHQKIDQNLDSDLLVKEIKKLKSEYQEVIWLRFVEDLSIEDIAQIVDKEKNSVRVLLHRALSKLKDNIKQAK